MTYTALDNLDTASYNDSNGATKLTHDYNYDAEENLWQVVENRSGYSQRSYTRQFDTRNRLTKTTDAYNKSVDFTYDTANNLKTLTSASRVTNYNYDGKNQLDTIVQNSATIANYDWYADGLLQKVEYSADKKREYVYDNADRVTNITNTIGTNSESFDYGYDANSNRASEVRKANGQAFRTIAYDYDKLDRLTKADYTATIATPNPPNNSQAVYVENTSLNNYGYDAVGNRLNEAKQNSSKTITLITDNNGQTTRSEQISTSPLTTTTATFDALNQLTQLNEPSGISTLSYDLNGNLSQINKNSSIISKYEYDVRNQLTKALDGLNNELARFDYDFERKRLTKTGAQGYQSYVYAGNQVISEYNAFGTATANYTIGAGEIVKSEFSNGENNLHFTDALGSVTSLANASNGSTSRNEYNAFGEVSTNGSSSNAIGYTGQRLDNETGLMALGNGERYYSPNYARFIQQDSFTGMPDMPQSMNRFSYAHNNPNKYTDPSGNVVFLIPLLLVALFVIRTETGRNNAEARRLEKGLTRSEAGNSSAIGLGEAFGFTSLVNGATGQDVYTGRDLSKWEARGQLALGATEIITNAVGAGQLLKGGTTIAGQGIKIFTEAESGLAGIKEVSKTAFRGAKTAAANEWVNTVDEFSTLKPFKETNLGKSFYATKDRVKNFFSESETGLPKSSSRATANDEFDDALNYQEADATRNLSRGETLRNKYSNLSREERLARIDDLAEANAGRRLAEMDAHNSGAHLYKRHGSDTTPLQQQRRAASGYTPDKVQQNFIPSGSTRFMSNRDQLRVIQRANFRRSITGEDVIKFKMEGVTGEGYLRGGSLQDYRTTNVFTTRYRNNSPYTSYPEIEP